MTHTLVQPILLCGGSGSRLWPLSRADYPKQFSDLTGAGESLLQSSARRLYGDGFAAPVILTSGAFRFVVTDQMAQAGVDIGALIIEPEGRNTAPAILVAALQIAAQDPDALIFVASSDHHIPDTDAFRATVQAGIPAAQSGQIVTFGIPPSRAETGYGYLELAEPGAARTPLPLTRFVEKPDAATAQDFVASDRFVWNAGLFLFTARTFLDAVNAHAPDLIEPVHAAYTGATPDLGFLRLDPDAWARVPDISVDYAVMEKAPNLSVVLYDGKWEDLGGWEAIWREGDADASGVVTHGPVTTLDCETSLLRADSPDLEIVGIGLKDTAVIAMDDAVLVADMSRTQDVKTAVARMKARGARQATQHKRDHRPWGWFETLALSDRFQVKRIVVKPGAALSLQSHVHRAEHWIVVEGTARVTIGEAVQLVSENQSVYVPLGAVHRMENPGRVPMVLIEVQTGSYLGEDDIIRYEDIYARGQGAKG